MPTPYEKKTPRQRSLAHAATKRWAVKNPEKKAEYRRTHYLANREKYLKIERARSYMKLYGITVADYDRMLSEQDGKCGICKRDTPSTNPRFQFFAVDHCHKSGKVRGLLCQKCNGTLGWHEANAESILGYLEKANS